MVILGDIACPTEALSLQLKNVFDENKHIFQNKVVVLNFEGLLGEENLLKAKVPVLFNHPSVIKSFEGFSQVTACLANNHILDLPENFPNTTSFLKKNEVSVCGAGNSVEEAHAPLQMMDEGQQVFVFNECWEFLFYHQKNPTGNVYVANIQFHYLVDRVKQCKEKNEDITVVIYLHWSLDLEILPYPMYRQFAQALIDAGAAVVAGCHSHCVQGGEQYKDGYIVYGLGNFFLPNHVFANGKLFFPSFAATQMVLEYKPQTREAFCHWFQYKAQNGQHLLQHVESSPFASSELLKKYSPYQQMKHKEYEQYFKKHRRKKILIPSFNNYQNKRMLQTQTKLLKTRATFARLMARVNLIKWGS